MVVGKKEGLLNDSVYPAMIKRVSVNVYTCLLNISIRLKNALS